jgi:GMP synthase-like glutamine amidotransferase
MIGLLQCDHVRPEFLPIAGDYDAMFRRWLPGEWRVYDVTRGERPAAIDECDAYVATGSRASVYDREPWIGAFAELVRELHETRAPFLGVCFGHQMIGHALGGRVARSPRGWGVGVHRFAVSAREPWMEPPAGSFGLLMSCQDQVEELPPDAVVLAGNDHCPVGMFRCSSLLGLQGHPEFPVEYARAVMCSRRERIGPERVDSALATLEGRTDPDTVAAWVRRFFSKYGKL